MEKSGRATLNLANMKCLLLTLCDNPNMRAKDLKPLLKEFIPRYQDCDSKTIANFCGRVMKYWLSHDQNEDKFHLTMEDAEKLASRTKMASDDIIDLDDKVTLVNLGRMFHKAMHGSCDTWETIRFLDSVKSEIPGLVYSVKYDGTGRPCAIMCMTPRMRNDLIQFGDLLFLDTDETTQHFGIPLHLSNCS